MISICTVMPPTTTRISTSGPMSTAPLVVKPPKEVSEARGVHNGGGPSGQSSNAPLASPAERFQAKQFLRIARIADVAIAVIVLLGAFLASNIERMPAGLEE